MNQYVSIKLPLIPRHPQPESQIRFPRFLVILASTVSLILLLTCAGLTPFSQAATFKVALLTPGTISDVGWNALAYDGLKAVEKLKKSCQPKKPTISKVKTCTMGREFLPAKV